MITITAKKNEIETEAQGSNKEVLTDILNMTKADIITPDFSQKLLDGAKQAREMKNKRKK